MATSKAVRSALGRPVLVTRRAVAGRTSSASKPLAAGVYPLAPILPRSRSPSMFKRHRRGKPVTDSKKQTIMNVYSKLREKHEGKTVCEIVAMTAELTGVSNGGVYAIKKECRTAAKLPVAVKQQRSKVARSRLSRYDGNVIAAIRERVQQMLDRHETPTGKKVCEAITSNGLAKLSVRTMQHILAELGFIPPLPDRRRPRQRRHRSVSAADEPEDIVPRRRRYLREIYQYRQQGRTIYYLDVMYLDETRPRSKDVTGDRSRGGRLIVLHAGNEEGFVADVDYICSACVADGAMDGPRFEYWLTTKLLPHIRPKSVLVMTDAPYHTGPAETIPCKSSGKDEIQNWLSGKGVLWSSDMIKCELLALVNGIRHLYDKCKVDCIAGLRGHAVLRLPPFHGELNPIEMVWNQVRTTVAAENPTFEMATLEQQVRRCIGSFTADSWSAHVGEVLKEEEAIWEIDAEADVDVVEPVDSSSSESGEGGSASS